MIRITILLYISLFVNVLTAQCLGVKSNTTNNHCEYNSTGDNDLDNFFTEQVILCLRVFELKKVDLYFCHTLNNAYAQNQSGIDKVVIGLKLIESLDAKLSKGRNAASKAITAHELAHVLQFERQGLSSLHSFQVELHADYLAGYLIGFLSSIDFANAEDARSFFAVFYSCGDNMFNSSSHHGTEQQRKNATILGWRAGRNQLALGLAYERGAEQIRNYYKKQG